MFGRSGSPPRPGTGGRVGDPPHRQLAAGHPGPRRVAGRRGLVERPPHPPPLFRPGAGGRTQRRRLLRRHRRVVQPARLSACELDSVPLPSEILVLRTLRGVTTIEQPAAFTQSRMGHKATPEVVPAPASYRYEIHLHARHTPIQRWRGRVVDATRRAAATTGAGTGRTATTGCSASSGGRRSSTSAGAPAARPRSRSSSTSAVRRRLASLSAGVGSMLLGFAG